MDGRSDGLAVGTLEGEEVGAAVGGNTILVVGMLVDRALGTTVGGTDGFEAVIGAPVGVDVEKPLGFVQSPNVLLLIGKTHCA